jgi:hypothetical protein
LSGDARAGGGSDVGLDGWKTTFTHKLTVAVFDDNGTTIVNIKRE